MDANTFAAATAERLVRPLADGSAPGETVLCQARSFIVEWTRCGGGAAALPADSPCEHFLLLPDTGAAIHWGGTVTLAPARAVVVVPPGESAVALDGAGRCIRLFAPVPEKWRDAQAAPAAMAVGAGRAMRAPVTGFERIAPAGVAVHALDAYPNSPGMPRAKLFQAATMSINWVEYVGPRDRTKLSPHAHTDFEQGSLALEGQFVHHLRTPWTPDANTWVADGHVACGMDTLAIIPPPIEHTTEGVGPERHVLIDIFAPPRRDFIARGQVLNAHEYRDTAVGGES